MTVRPSSNDGINGMSSEDGMSQEDAGIDGYEESRLSSCDDGIEVSSCDDGIDGMNKVDGGGPISLSGLFITNSDSDDSEGCEQTSEVEPLELAGMTFDVEQRGYHPTNANRVWCAAPATPREMSMILTLRSAALQSWYHWQQRGDGAPRVRAGCCVYTSTCQQPTGTCRFR